MQDSLGKLLASIDIPSEILDLSTNRGTKFFNLKSEDYSFYY